MPMPALKIGFKVQQDNLRGPKTSIQDKANHVFGGHESDDEDHSARDKTSENIVTLDDAQSGNAKFKSESLIINDRNTGNAASAPRVTKNKSSVTPSIDLSSHRAQNKKIEEAEALDSSIYDYDAAYDAIHAKSAAKKAAERADAEQRKPKYMSSLLEAAEIRKRDQLRAKDKLLQREREAEGDAFADKERFVTGAYKEQQEEVRRLAEEERSREEQEEARRRANGMRGFYQNVMDDQERKHKEIVEAAADAVRSIEADVPVQYEKTITQIAQEMNAKGASILINEEGQVADKRQLLTAGLNVVAKPKAAGPESTRARLDAESKVDREGLHHRGTTHKAMRERQTRMMEAQLEQATKRAAEVADNERQRMERAAKSRKTEADVSSARERYLQRKREAAVATATKQ